MTTKDSEHSESTPAAADRGFPSNVSRFFEWLFLDLPYLLFSPEGLLWKLLRGLGRLLLALPRWILMGLWWLLRPAWLWLARVTGLTALGRVYVQLEKPARIIFWVPVMLANKLLQNIIGGIIPIIIVAVIFIYFNKFVLRDAAEKQLQEMVKRHPN